MTYRDWDKAQSQTQTSYKRRYEASQQALKMALRENRVRDECLEIAIKALAEIKARLAELEPEEETE